jgi:D-glycero-alpha-D-manno-heptose-7-phosphate kinase
MMISRTPLRVSFCGGGSDLPAFYRQSTEGGCVTSLSLAAHIHVTVNKRFGDDIRLSYSKTEIVDDFEDLQHELVREAMRITGVTSGVEITTIADIPSRGTGLGSSSAVTVGLLNALHSFAGNHVSPEELAEQACKIEIDVLGQPIGRQDQYGCAMGGINHIKFLPDDSVEVEALEISKDTISKMEDEFTLLYTGLTRSADSVLKEQSENTSEKISQLQLMCAQAKTAKTLLQNGDLEGLGKLLHEGWMLKKQLSSSVSIPEIDSLYQTILDCGATGGKLLGAGGGGFILFHGLLDVRQRVAQALPDNQMLPLRVERNSTRIIFDSSNLE